jgi:hypothetical protein
MSHWFSRSVFTLVLVIATLTFFPDNSRAQTFNATADYSAQAGHPEPRVPGESPGLGWGVKSGAQWSSFDEVSDGLNHVGGMLGIFIDFNQRGAVGVTGDLLFTNSPQVDESGVPAGTLHVLEAPVMLRLRRQLSANDRYAVFGIVGPAFGLKLSGGDDFEGQVVDLAYGGGLEVKDILIEARFRRGSRDRVIAGVSSSYTQQAFAILVGFRMRP